MNSENDRFMFNSTSANKPPGSGVMEFVNSKHIYKEVSKISEWRKMLSVEYVHDIEIHEIVWPSLENFLIAETFYKHKLEDYNALQNKSTPLTKYRAKTKNGIYDTDAMNQALRIKFSKTHPDFSKVLMSTKNATLTNWKRGNPVLLNEDFRYVEPNEICIIMMEIRKEIKAEHEANAALQADTVDICNTNDETDTYQPVKENNIQRELKILSKKDFDDFISKYDKSQNRSLNRLTIYEKTNVIGVRMEQLSMGAEPLIDEFDASTLNSVKLIALEEYRQKKIPFVVCRNMPNNQKEYWKLDDMIMC